MNDPRVPPPEAVALAFSEPPPLARAVWPELAAGMERLDALRAKQVDYDQEVIRLRENLPAVRARDQAALGEALAGGDPEPEPEAPTLEAEIERLIRNSAAMLPVIAEEIREVTRLIERAKANWTRDLNRRLTDAATAYRAAVVALAQARERVVAEVQLGAWLSQFPELGVQADGFGSWRSAARCAHRTVLPRGPRRSAPR